MRGATETFSDGIPPEVAPVRAGEDLPWDRVQAYLARELGVTGPMEVLQFPNGSANLTYLASFGERRFVLRRPPFGVLAPGAHDMKREYRVLSRLWQAYDRAPRAFLLCEDHEVAGGDLLVSEYRPGTVVWAQVPPELEAPGAGRRLGLAVVDALADLHAVDPAACGLE
ncbi:MAG: aminoglycoside phosphotransferase, partial [Frankiales bacterium]|nr:aminoglycoside phosphotransferase [Frankiales bacterium]